MQSSASEKTIYEYLLRLKNGSILLMHQTVLRSIYSVQLFWAAGRRQTEVNLALSSMLVGVWNVLRLHGVPNWLSSSETLSGKIHCVLGIMVDLHSFSQGLRISAVALSWHMTAFCTVMIFIHQMIPCSECYKPGIICRGWNRDGACAPHIGVA